MRWTTRYPWRGDVLAVVDEHTREHICHMAGDPTDADLLDYAWLIAAAPDLLAAVRAILDEVSGEYDGWAKDAVSVLRIREIAQAAIARATRGKLL